MILYVILTRNIINIGGAEIYTRNKLIYLKDSYDVVIISANHGKIYINELKQFADSIVEELEIDPFYYSYNQRMKILAKLKELLPIEKQYKDIIIESQTVQLSLWGELLASTINGRAFCLLTEDRFPVLSPSANSFFKFKLFRKELAGIATESLSYLFRNNYKVPSDKRYKLSFTCNNSIEDIESSFIINRNNYDIVIGTLTRLEKVCVPFILNEISKFAKNNPSKNILFVFFGGSQNSKLEKKIITEMSIYKNLTFFLTGIIFPIPLSEVQKIDLFINVAGAANATKKNGIPTLSIDLETGKPIGFLGYNTNSIQYKSDNNSFFIDETISDVLEQVFITNKYSLGEIRSKLIKIKSCVDYSSHKDFINSSIKSNPKDYYDFTDYQVPHVWKFLISMLYSLIGIRSLKAIMKIYRSFIKKK